MTKKDYILIASVFRDIEANSNLLDYKEAEELFNLLVSNLSNAIKEAYPTFTKDRFIKFIMDK